MKKHLLFILLVFFNLLNTYAQANVCESKEESIEDLNTININKCEITANKKNPRKILKNRTVRKRVINSSRKKNTLLANNNTQKVLFSVVENIPMFDSCKNSNRTNNIKCFKTKINNHFTKNFNPDKFINEDIDKKVYIQFSIDLRGKVINAKVKSKRYNTLLHKELNTIIDKLPRLTPGKEKGLPVVVTYSFALNLSSE